MIFSENRYPPWIKSGVGFFGVMLWPTDNELARLLRASCADELARAFRLFRGLAQSFDIGVHLNLSPDNLCALAGSAEPGVGQSTQNDVGRPPGRRSSFRRLGLGIRPSR